MTLAQASYTGSFPSLETGDVLQHRQTPGQIMTIVGTCNVASSPSLLPAPSCTPASASASEAARARGSGGGVRIVVGGKWSSMLVLDMGQDGCAGAYAAERTEEEEEVAHGDDLRAALLGNVSQKSSKHLLLGNVPRKGVSKTGSNGWDQVAPVESNRVLCSWLSDNGLTLAYGDGSVCRVRDLSGTPSEVHALRCHAAVSDLWGSHQSGLLIASLANASILGWCLTSAAVVLRIKCEAVPNAISGFGTIAENNLSVVASTMHKAPRGRGFGGHVHVWRISSRGTDSKDEGLFADALGLNEQTPCPSKDARGPSASGCYRSGGPATNGEQTKSTLRHQIHVQPHHQRHPTFSRLAALDAKLKAEKMSATLLHEVAVRHRINGLWADQSGAMVAGATSSGGVIVIRLDDISCSGPSLRMLTRSHNLTQDLSLYMPVLGSTLMDGSLMEWLIASGKDRHLQQLLSVRPSAALMPLACGKSALELATLMRSSQTLEQLLLAAVEFARNGEPAFDAIASPEANAGGRGGGRKRRKVVERGLRLVPPAMRRVTDCIRVALQSVDMAEVIFRFLRQLETFELDVPPKFLPRTVTQRFQGSPSPSGRQANEHDHLIWTTQHSEQGGFPSAAKVVVLPGLANATILELLSDQTSELLYTEPIRCLIDAMRQNGIDRIFYVQCAGFFSLICFYTFFVMATVSTPPRFPALHLESQNMFSINHALSHPIVWTGAASGALSCLISVYFLWREAHELFSTSDEVERIDFNEHELLSRLGVAFASPDAQDASAHLSAGARTRDTTAGGEGGGGVGAAGNVLSKIVGSTNRSSTHCVAGPGRGEAESTSNLAKSSSRNGVGRMELHRRGSAFSMMSFLSDTRDRLSIPHLTRTNSSLTAALDWEPSSTWRKLINAISWKNKLRSAATLTSEAGVRATEEDYGTQGETSGPLWCEVKAPSSSPFSSSFTSGSKQNERRPGIVFKRLSSASELAKRLRRHLRRTLRINVSYFFKMWNALGLLAYALVLASYIRFVLTWLRCARAAAAGTDGGNGGDGDEVCAGELVKLRVLAALAIPILYLYSLYYVRCVDRFAFYVRMLKEIIADFMPFLVIFIWFLLSVTTGIWSLKCSAAPVSHEDAPAAFAALLQGISLIPFEIQVSPLSPRSSMLNSRLSCFSAARYLHALSCSCRMS